MAGRMSFTKWGTWVEVYITKPPDAGSEVATTALGSMALGKRRCWM